MATDIMITTIPSDAHTWNLVYMQTFIEECGFTTFNLGSCPSYDLIISECHVHQPFLLVVSTINGHGYIEGLELIKKIRQHDLIKKITITIGGKLTTKGNLSSKEKMNLLKKGYSSVFEGDDAINDFPKYLKALKTNLQMYEKFDMSALS